MDWDIVFKYGTGEARALAAETWFTFLGFVAAIAVLHAVAEQTDAWPIVVLKWVSYLMLFGWVSYKTDQVIWAHFPSADPRKKKATPKHIAFSVWFSVMVTVGVYWLAVFLINAFVKTNVV